MEAEEGSRRISLDTAMEEIGGFGLFQWKMFILMGLVNMRGAGFLLGIVFIGDTPSHHCAIPYNSTVNHSIPWIQKDGSYQLDSCIQYTKNKQDYLINTSITTAPNDQTEPCKNGWTYQTDYKSTIVTQWDLVCDSSYFVELSTTIFVFGSSMGSLLISPLSDHFGRKKVLITCLMMQAVLGASLAVVSNVYQFIALRFFIGALNRANDVIAFVLMTESFLPKHRTLPCVYNQVFWAVGLMILSLLAYFIRNWRYLQLFISLPILGMFTYIWFVPESIRWLLSVNKSKEANDVFRDIATLNRHSLPDNTVIVKQEELLVNRHNNLLSRADSNGATSVDDINMTEQHQSPSTIVIEDIKSMGCWKIKRNSCVANNNCVMTFMKLCCFHKMRMYTIIICFLWMVNSLDYYGISLSTSSLAGNRYLNFFISAAVEVPAYIVVAFALQRFGRCKCICCFHVISGVANISTAFIPGFIGTTDMSALITTLAMIGKFGITASFSSMFVYSAEVFPTVVRNSAIGFAAFWDTVGGMAAPFILYSAKIVDIIWLPRTVFGSLSIVAGAVVLLMPETLNKPLPETVEDVQSWENGCKMC